MSNFSILAPFFPFPWESAREAERHTLQIDEAIQGGVTDAFYPATGSLTEFLAWRFSRRFAHRKT
jgi:hypothetical protein